MYTFDATKAIQALADLESGKAKPLTHTRRTLVARCMREAIIFHIVGDLRQDLREYKKELQGCTTADLSREYALSAYHDYPLAQIYLKSGGLSNRRKALRAIMGSNTNPSMC